MDAGISDRWLQVDDALATGRVNVTIGGKGEPAYDIVANSAWDAIEPLLAEAEALRAAHFDVGTLAQRSPRSRDTLNVLRKSLPDVPVFYDVNLRFPHTPLETVRATLPGVTLLKLNELECSAIAGMFGFRSGDFGNLYAHLHVNYGIKAVLVTLGPRGCVLVSDEGAQASSPVPARVVSTVGAGDAMAAVFLCGWLRQVPAIPLLALANKVAAWVTTQEGATPWFPKNLQDDIFRTLFQS